MWKLPLWRKLRRRCLDLSKSSQKDCIVTVIHILELEEVTLSQLERMELEKRGYMKWDAQQKEEESKRV